MKGVTGLRTVRLYIVWKNLVSLSNLGVKKCKVWGTIFPSLPFTTYTFNVKIFGMMQIQHTVTRKIAGLEFERKNIHGSVTKIAGLKV